MPLYEYQCGNCENAFEIRRPIKDADAPTSCPQCGGTMIQRRLSLFIAVTKHDDSTRIVSGGSCGCGGACACGGHNLN